LHAWEDWVLYDHPEVNCPFFHNSGEHHCHWPSQLTLEANDRGATFELQLQLYADSAFALPGDHEHWPSAVMGQGRRLAIADQQGIPVGHLPAGSYTLRGQFHWSQVPRTLRLPAETGLVSLTLKGEVIEPVRLEQRHQLILGETRVAQEARPQDSLTVR